MKTGQYKNLVLSMVESNEDAKTLLGLVYVLKEYASEEALMRNFAAIRGKGREKECKDLLKSLWRKRILGIGPYDEYICPEGHEKEFGEVTSRFFEEPPKLSEIVKAEIEAGNKAAITMIWLLLKMGIHGVRGFTQYEFIKSDMSDMYSSAAFQSLEDSFLAERLCVYGQRKPGHEFLWLYNQTDEELKTASDMIMEFREREFSNMPMIKELEDKIDEVVTESKKAKEGWKEGFAEWAKFSEDELETVSGYFSGFMLDEDFLSLTGNMYVEDTLHLVVTDKLSRYNVREWREQPVVFVTAEMPIWIKKIKTVFEDSYPKYSDRKLAIAVPNEAAYANFEQGLLSKLMKQLGIESISKLQPGGD